MNTQLLTTESLAIGYCNGSKTIVVAADIDVALRRQRLTCLLGANGKGKSTLLRTLAATQQPLSGHVMIEGRDISGINKKRLAREISIVSTERTQAGALTVEELTSLGRQPHTGFLGRLSDDDRRITHTAMQQSGIYHKRDSYVADLSDGERQKAMIARALAQQTPIILLDEPTAFLDVASKIETMKLLQALARDEGKAILLSTHDVGLALMYADELITIDSHGKVEQGTPEEMNLAEIFGESAKEYISALTSATVTK